MDVNRSNCLPPHGELSPWEGIRNGEPAPMGRRGCPDDRFLLPLRRRRGYLAGQPWGPDTGLQLDERGPGR
jgi:hypothetical protein